jgi:hypothetical protein
MKRSTVADTPAAAVKNLLLLSTVFFLCAGTAVRLSAQSAAPVMHGNPVMSIDVAVLNDLRLPALSDEDIKLVLAETKATLKQKFGLDNLTFNTRGSQSVDQFFLKYLNRNSPRFKQYDAVRYRFFQKNDYTPYKDRIIKFLGRYKVWDLADFFPGKKDSLKTYEDIVPVLMDTWYKKVSDLENLKLRNGTWLISRGNNSFQSYANWLAVMGEQDAYDLVIANTFIVYDVLTEPYPHVVTRLAKVGGSSFESPKRKGFGGSSAMFNTFEMLTDIPYFKGAYTNRGLTIKDWDRIIGAYVVAHELGHMLFLIPDVYNHDRGCLMDSSYENLDYVSGYQIIKQNPEPCTKCQPYVDARNMFFSAESKYNSGDFAGAAEDYRLSAKMSPDKLDIDYTPYMALLYARAAQSYFKAGNRDNAVRYVTMSLQRDPGNAQALELKKVLGQ